nr:hypothetical protein [Candidatus Freyarchaeota archaeon]
MVVSGAGEVREIKTPDGGWEQRHIDRIVVQNEKTQTSVEKTSVFSRGETPEGDKVLGFAEGFEAQTRLWIDSNKFDDLFVKVRSIEQVQSVETERPVDLSLMKFPKGEPVKGELHIHTDPELKDVRMVGKTTETWRDDDGLPHVRTTRWMILKPEKGETKEETPKADEDKTQLFGYAKINEIHPSKGKIDRKETFTWFFPVGQKSGESVKGEAKASARAEGRAETGEPPQSLKLLFRNGGIDASKHEYRVKHEVTEVVYLPTETDTKEETTRTSSVAENVEKTDEKMVEETAEKTVEKADEKTTEILEEPVEKTDKAIGEVKTSEKPVEKIIENPSEETAEDEEKSVLVERGDVEQASSEDVLRMVMEGIFRAGGEEEYYQELRERGVQFDIEKLKEILFVERRIPEEVYSALKSLWREGEGRKSGDEEASKLEADTEPDAEGVLTSSKEEEEREDTPEETKREPQAQEQHAEEEEQELGLENLFIIILNILQGVTYSLSKQEVLNLFNEAMRKAGSEEKFTELLKRKKAGHVTVELLYDMLQRNEVPLELLGAVLGLAEKTQSTENKVQVMVKKTLQLIKRMGVDLLRNRGIDPQGSMNVDEEKDEAGSAEKLRRKGYAYLGQLLGKYMSKKGLLDDWIFDIIMMRKGKDAGVGQKKKLEDANAIEKRLREVWASLGMDARFKLSTIIDEVYYRLERRDLLVFLYNGRVDPRGRKGRVASFVDVLEVLVEAVKKAGNEENFLEMVRRKTGRLFYQHLVDEQLAQHRLDEEILRVATEYVYGTRDKIEERLKLIDRNTEYILTRLKEETVYLSHLEQMLKPLAELNNRLEQSEQVTLIEEYTGEKGKSLKKESTSPNKAQPNEIEAKQEVEDLTPENIKDEKRWLETLQYEKPTVLIQGKVFSFTLFSKDVLSAVKEAEKKSKSEGDLVVLAACYEAIKQFKEEQCINLYHLLTIARYLRKSEEETGSPDEETEEIPDIYTSELEEIEELLKLLGVKYRKAQEGIEVREALEPYDSIKIPKKNIKKIIKIKNNKHLTLRNLCDKLNKMGLLINLEPFTLKNYLRRESIPVDVYLGICYILGIKKDVKLLTRWRKLNVEKAGKAEGKWYNNYDIRVRIHPESLRNLYMELLNELEKKKISLDKFAVSLGEAGSTISRGSHLSEILDRKFVDTIALLEICNFLDRDPQTLRELDHNSLPLEETVSLPRKVIRLLRSETIKKYKQFTQLAKKINESPNNIKLYFLGTRGIPIEILKKIEKALDIEVKDSLHTRMKVGRRDYSREIIGEVGDEWEIMIEKIEIKEADSAKRPLLTFIHRRDKEGGVITTEVPQTGETAKSTPTPWWLSSPNTNITIDRTKEFKKGKDLLTYITKKCVNKAGTAWKLAKILDVPEDISERLLKDKENDTITLRTLLALAMYSDEIKKLSELTDYVEKVGIIEKKHNPDLTINWNNPEGAHIILNLHGDGGFWKKRKWAYTIYYSNSQIDFINTFINNIKKVSGIPPTINEKSGQYIVVITSNLVGVALIRAGVKTGIKTRTNPKIPKWIIEGHTQIRKTAIKAIIADEGNTQDAQLRISNYIDAPELEQYRSILNQIEGIIMRTPTGTIFKRISIGKLKSYNEILNIVNTKQSNILRGVKKIIGSLLEEHGMKLEEGDLKIITTAILVYTNRISISKQIELSTEATRKLHQILDGFPGYKELMYINHMSAHRRLKIPLRLSEKEVESLKKIGTQRIINDKVHYFVPVEKLPEELKQYANPPDGILKMQKEYSEEEVEILIEGNPIKVKGMPSRIRGEIILGPNRNVVSWSLIPALVEAIKKKWENVKNTLNEGKGRREKR